MDFIFEQKIHSRFSRKAHILNKYLHMTTVPQSDKLIQSILSLFHLHFCLSYSSACYSIVENSTHNNKKTRPIANYRFELFKFNGREMTLLFDAIARSNGLTNSMTDTVSNAKRIRSFIRRTFCNRQK